MMNTQKNEIKSRDLPWLAVTSDVSIYIKMCVFTFCESLVKICRYHKCRLFFCYVFRYRAVTTRIINLTFSKYARPLHKLVQAGVRTYTDDNDDDRQNYRITFLYMIHFALRHTSENSKKTRNISLPEDVNNEILLSKI